MLQHLQQGSRFGIEYAILNDEHRGVMFSGHLIMLEQCRT